MSIQDLSGYLGLCATATATVNLWLGTMMSIRYSPVRHWPHRRINVFALHQWSAYLVVVLVLVHPALLLLVKSRHFGVFDLLWPIHSPLQPYTNLAGAIAVYLLVVLLVTSLLRNRIGRTLWRNLHYLAFPAVVLIFVHSLLTDPTLQTGHPRLLDARKFCVMAAMLCSAIAIGVRIALRGKGLRASTPAKLSA